MRCVFALHLADLVDKIWNMTALLHGSLCHHSGCGNEIWSVVREGGGNRPYHCPVTRLAVPILPRIYESGDQQNGKIHVRPWNEERERKKTLSKFYFCVIQHLSAFLWTTKKEGKGCRLTLIFTFFFGLSLLREASLLLLPVALNYTQWPGTDRSCLEKLRYCFLFPFCMYSMLCVSWKAKRERESESLFRFWSFQFQWAGLSHVPLELKRSLVHSALLFNSEPIEVDWPWGRSVGQWAITFVHKADNLGLLSSEPWPWASARFIIRLQKLHFCNKPAAANNICSTVHDLTLDASFNSLNLESQFKVIGTQEKMFWLCINLGGVREERRKLRDFVTDFSCLANLAAEPGLFSLVLSLPSSL